MLTFYQINLFCWECLNEIKSVFISIVFNVIIKLKSLNVYITRVKCQGRLLCQQLNIVKDDGVTVAYAMWFGE